MSAGAPPASAGTTAGEEDEAFPEGVRLNADTFAWRYFGRLRATVDSLRFGRIYEGSVLLAQYRYPGRAPERMTAALGVVGAMLAGLAGDALRHSLVSLGMESDPIVGALPAMFSVGGFSAVTAVTSNFIAREREIHLDLGPGAAVAGVLLWWRGPSAADVRALVRISASRRPGERVFVRMTLFRDYTRVLVELDDVTYDPDDAVRVLERRRRESWNEPQDLTADCAEVIAE